MAARLSHVLLLASVPGFAVAPLGSAASAQPTAAQSYDIPPQSLAATLRAIARASGVNVLASSGLVQNHDAPAIRGRYTVGEALSLALRPFGLRTRASGAGLVVEAAPGEAPSLVPNDDQTIVVTGSRIRGAPLAAPVIRIDQRSMRDAGQGSIGEVVRTIPQSFGGGQQPGIGFNVPSANGVDVGGGSSINLRGLGSDATLTLLNGHRLAYSSSRQSVDVSSIPLSILDRIEIVPDGASAIYGSDAVAGVANIVLKRDYQGLETRTRLGGSTDGGNFTQQYGVLGGAVWQNGGFALAYEFNSNDAIKAHQRSYARDTRPGLDLYPKLHSHSALLTGHQELSDTLTFSLDALYGRRSEKIVYPLASGGNLNALRGEQRSWTRAWALAPSLAWSPSEDWEIQIAGTAARDRTTFNNDAYSGSALTSRTAGCYCNSERSVEVSGSGTLAHLASGSVKTALGVGYRRNALDFIAGAGNAQNFSHAQSSRYVYAEASVPLASPAQEIRGAERLSLTAAVRYEHYAHVGDVATPKVGLIYAPTRTFDLKASWGKSFRAATLRQQFQPKSVTLFRPSAVGGSGFPAAAAVAYVSGGNPALAPERATSWSATFDLHPPGWGGARLEVSYFHTGYRDRIVTPIALRSQALTNPIYREYVRLAPTPAEVAALVSSAATFINSSQLPYDPSTVVAIVDSSNVNAGRQRIHGLDLILSDHWDLGDERSIDVSANASYLTSDQRITAAQATTKLAGNIFNPPRLRVRASAAWRDGPLTLTAAVSRIGGVDDVRSAPTARIGGMVPVDLALRYLTTKGGPLGGVDLTVAVQNVLNDKPSTIAGIFLDAPYDSTNYSPVGRFISISIAKRW